MPSPISLTNYISNQSTCPITRLVAELSTNKTTAATSHAFSTLHEIPQSLPLQIWEWTQTVATGLAATIATLLAGGILYQAISTKLDNAAYPPPGKMVDIGGYSLHITCKGESGPTVVCDSGLGCNCLEWTNFQNEASKFAKIFAVDRAGYGWSDESPLPRTSENIAQELHTLLHNAGVRGPYILVGHSLGGLNLRLFASKYPDEVAGMVLVDAPHENSRLMTPPINKTLGMFFAYTGLSRLVTHAKQYRDAIKCFGDNIQEMYLAKVRTNSFLRTVLNEMSNLQTNVNQMKAANGSLGDKPLIVVTAGKTIASEGTGYTDEQIKEMNESFQALQKDLVTKSTRGIQMIAENSDNMITRRQPEIIVSALREVCQMMNTH